MYMFGLKWGGVGGVRGFGLWLNNFLGTGCLCWGGEWVAWARV